MVRSFGLARCGEHTQRRDAEHVPIPGSLDLDEAPMGRNGLYVDEPDLRIGISKQERLVSLDEPPLNDNDRADESAVVDQVAERVAPQA